MQAFLAEADKLLSTIVADAMALANAAITSLNNGNISVTFSSDCANPMPMDVVSSNSDPNVPLMIHTCCSHASLAAATSMEPKRSSGCATSSPKLATMDHDPDVPNCKPPNLSPQAAASPQPPVNWLSQSWSPTSMCKLFSRTSAPRLTG